MAFLRHRLLSVVLLLIYLELNNSQTPFETAFRDCHKSSPQFDNCIKNALNAIRPHFKTGVPEWNIPPFDPFFAEEVVQKMGTPYLNYNLKLINATEAGWTQSKVIKFRSDFENNLIRYTQYFPAKFLKGMYEFSADILGNRLGLAGYWNLDLFGFVQTTTITRKPRKLDDGSYVYDTPLKVEIEVQSTKGLALHISNLLGGRKKLETLLDKIINFAWPPGFVISKPLVNDLVGTAFTGIFNKAFQNFSFDAIIH